MFIVKTLQFTTITLCSMLMFKHAARRAVPQNVPKSTVYDLRLQPALPLQQENCERNRIAMTNIFMFFRNSNKENAPL